MTGEALCAMQREGAQICGSALPSQRPLLLCLPLSPEAGLPDASTVAFGLLLGNEFPEAVCLPASSRIPCHSLHQSVSLSREEPPGANTCLLLFPLAPTFSLLSVHLEHLPAILRTPRTPSPGSRKRQRRGKAVLKVRL